MVVRSWGLCLLTALVLLPGVFSLAACSKEKQAEPERLVNVRVWTAETRTVQPYLETTGTLKADEEVLVSSEVDGLIRDIYVEEGTSVVRGTLLARINETDYHLDAKRADAMLRQAEATLANARAEFKRKEALYREELITRQQFDDISTRVTLAEAELERARATQAISRERLVRAKIYSRWSARSRKSAYPSATTCATERLCSSSSKSIRSNWPLPSARRTSAP
jgi:multidrug efflux pump subunit AcrA (membrane-fusion protein)